MYKRRDKEEDAMRVRFSVLLSLTTLILQHEPNLPQQIANVTSIHYSKVVVISNYKKTACQGFVSRAVCRCSYDGLHLDRASSRRRVGFPVQIP